MNIREWFTPARTVALALLLVGGGLQLYALVADDSSSVGHAGLVLLMLGLIIEFLAHGIGNDK